MKKKPQLKEEDQARVDEYLNSGFNKTEKKPYSWKILLLILFVVVTALGIFSLWLADFVGIE